MRLTLFLDHQCNLACTYCYNGEKFTRPMTRETAFRAIDLVLESGHKLDQLGFFGGEPLMHLDMVLEASKYALEKSTAAGHKCLLVATSNGTLVTPETAARLKELNFHLGVSIDGPQPAHDACRVYRGGQSSHAAVEAGIKAAQKAGIPVKVISVVDPANVDYVPDTLTYLLGLGIRNVSLNINYEGNWDDPARDRFKVALRNLADRFVQHYREGIEFRVNLLDAKIITHVKMGFACGDRCDFGCEEWAVSPSGKIYPCDRLVGEDSRDDVVIGDIWKGVDVARRDALVARKNAMLDECAACDIAHRCMHWCGCVNYAMTGDVGEVSGLLCWFEQAIVEEADRAAEILFQEKNPLFVKRFYPFI